MERGHLRRGAATPSARRSSATSPSCSRAHGARGELAGMPGFVSDVRDLLEPLPAIQIDVGIAEPAAAEGRMAVVPLDAGWSDIGSWSALLEAMSSRPGQGARDLRPPSRPGIASRAGAGRRPPGGDRGPQRRDHRRHARTRCSSAPPTMPRRSSRSSTRSARRPAIGTSRPMPDGDPALIGPTPAAAQEDRVRFAWLARLAGRAMARYLRLVAATSAPAARRSRRIRRCSRSGTSPTSRRHRGVEAARQQARHQLHAPAASGAS